ncbi:TMEM198/TM7SF3 family protein [Halobacterium litoreum]|uniref:DUF4203 domain-containing protein n=1 Tax=Halobacterium litoreum TaxID=2039234 RepID=A0ABD5NER4_9EURY|nr:TMEM198/TM7SF3 family protein [Halobacterium litoreum]UHH13573.1 TMEM198/TM7SF3 family protein [Halobacterium litoreum]
MDVPVQAGLVVGGLLLGVAGVHIERVAVMLVGFVPGAFAGATLAPQFVSNAGDGGALVVTAAVGLVGGIVGAQLAWSAWVLVHAIPGFVAGVAVTAPAVGVSTSDPSLGPEIAVVLLAGVAGAVLAWAVHRVFVAVLTAGVGSAMVNVAVLGQDVYLPTGRALLQYPETELRLVVESARDLGTPFVGLAVVFALVQLASLAATENDEERGE